jgi:hypothetical protein
VYGSCKGQFSVLDLATTNEERYWVGAESFYGNGGSDLIYRFQRVSPMEVSPHDGKVVYYGSQYVHRTRDGGVNWERISPDLTAKPEGTQGPSGEPITRDATGEEIYSTLYSIRESPVQKGVIWAGSNDGPIHVSRDDGKTWTNVTPKGLLPGGRVQNLEPGAHNAATAYAAIYRFLVGDFRPYIYRTDDYGKTWTLLTDGKNGIAADEPTRVVREDPVRAGLLYAGTEFGMYISFDNGGHWQPFQLNLPNVPITDIKVHHKDLVVSTQGRAFWILDNVTPLHQLTPQTTSTEIRLLAPRDGYRTRTAAGVLGPNIDYYLPSVPPGPVFVDILDGSGAIVNSYNSDAPVGGGRGGRGRGGAPAESDDPDAAPAFGRGRGGLSPRVTKVEGMNRFVWDVRNQSGISVPPGSYQARLRVGSLAQTQPFTVLIDPNVAADGVTVADLKEQFEHNLRMRQLVADAGQLAARLRDLQSKLRPGAQDGEKTNQDSGALDAIAERLFSEPVRYGKPGLQAHITYLAGMTTGADQKIGRDAVERYAVLRKELDGLRAEFDKVAGTNPK